jgi:ribonuclease Y
MISYWRSHVTEILQQLEILNEVIPFWAALIGGLGFGVLTGFVIYGVLYAARVRGAQETAEEMVQESKDALELLEIEQKEKMQEIELELWSKDEKYLLELEEKIEDLESLVDEKKQKLDQKYSQERQKTVQFENQIKSEEQRIRSLDSELQKTKSQLQTMINQLSEKLSTRLELPIPKALEELTVQILREAQEKITSYYNHLEEEVKEHQEVLAKTLLANALMRFARPYSAERGISAVYFENPEQRRILVDANGDNIKVLNEITGCEIIVEEGMELVGVAGFDPVRRELSRRILERCLKEKKPLNPDSIRKIAENQKRELLSQIKRDGDNLAKELKLDNLHPEIRQMMGSLRFRYSFTQNQYFHCGEVGWLAGLLASELGTVMPKKARRSGMLHDLGKAMDHELDGGHAVIGADFIQKRNEAPDIIHAVRAHHYDEQPSTDMAFIVIAADAISGARPGARRSTVESYNQKVTELESIARSFDGVTDCFILSGGREVRVLVNGKRIDDLKAIKLSHEMARKIEAECNYPGQIKVVVVRETLTVEITRAF